MPIDVSKNADEIKYISERLIEILKEEGKSMSGRDYLNFPQKLLDEKLQLSRLYERHFNILVENKFNGLEDDIKEELREVATELDEVMEDNAKKLKVNIEVTQITVDGIAKIAKELSKPIDTYDATGSDEIKGNVKPVTFNKEY